MRAYNLPYKWVDLTSKIYIDIVNTHSAGPIYNYTGPIQSDIVDILWIMSSLLKGKPAKMFCRIFFIDYLLGVGNAISYTNSSDIFN